MNIRKLPRFVSLYMASVRIMYMCRWWDIMYMWKAWVSLDEVSP